MQQSYEFVDGSTFADIGIKCYSSSVSGLFEINCIAFLNLCIDNPDDLLLNIDEKVKIVDSGYDIILFKLYNELIYLKDVKSLLLKPVNIILNESSDKVELIAHLKGNYISDNLILKVDPKAATLHKLSFKNINNGLWQSYIIVDV